MLHTTLELHSLAQQNYSNGRIIITRTLSGNEKIVHLPQKETRKRQQKTRKKHSFNCVYLSMIHFAICLYAVRYVCAMCAIWKIFKTFSKCLYRKHCRYNNKNIIWINGCISMWNRWQMEWILALPLYVMHVCSSAFICFIYIQQKNV